MSTNATGPAMFADLSTDELDIAIEKLVCGATTAARVTRDYAFHAEAHEVIHVMQAAWRIRFAAEHPKAAM